MASAQHPTIEPEEDAAETEDEPVADQSARPGVGLAHPTVVPTNADSGE